MRCSLNEKTNVRSLPTHTEELHLVRPISYKKALAILKRCKQLKTITMSISTYRRIPRKVLSLLKERNIKVAICEERGRPIGIPLEKLKIAIEMRRDFRPLREIEHITGIPKSTIHYLVKYSAKRKVKKGNVIIHLKSAG